jgi:hypothetical protein
MRIMKFNGSFTRGMAYASVFLLAACAGDPAGGETDESGDDEGVQGSSGGGGPKLDVDPGSGTQAEGAEGGEVCKQVDVILAVDNSGSMVEEIAALRGPVFDSLPEQLLDVGNGIDDFHLAVIDACPKAANYHDTGNGGACDFSTGRNYMISSSEVLADEFACVTDFSTAGYMGMPDMCEDAGENADDDEQPALTAATSVDPAYLVASNLGFLRADSLLFVVAITDEDEEFLGTDANAIYDALVEAKGGNPEHVVFLGISGSETCTGPYGGAEPSPNMQSVVNEFASYDRGIYWDLCQGDLEGAFALGIETLDQACDDWIPAD